MKQVVRRGNCILFFLSIVSLGYAQNLSGIWRGHFRSNEVFQRYADEDDRYKMEVQIAQEGKSFEAVTYSYKTTLFYGKADATGTFDFNSKKVLLRELKIVELRMVSGYACIMTCFMQYSKLGDEEFLEGRYTSMNTHDSSDCGKGTIFLHKVPETDFYKEPFLEKKEKQLENDKKKITTPPLAKKTTHPNTPVIKKDTSKNVTAKKTAPAAKKPAIAVNKPVSPQIQTAVPKKELAKADPGKHLIEAYKNDSVIGIEKKSIPLIIPKQLAGRSNEVVRTITVTNPEITLNIYDDGAIDNDTVSVYYDKKLIVSKARLTDRAIVVKLHIDESGDSHELVMVAENLGDIPPNTSLLTVKAGEKQYEVRIVSTEQKNAVIIFKYEKP